ncbi:MAG: GtrA family protein, partial [Dysgonomonas sp.]
MQRILIHKLYTKYQTLIKYGIIGAISAGLDFVIYSFLTSHFVINYQIANVISVHCGIICSFLLNREYNFKVKDKLAKRFLSFYSVGLLGLGLSALLLHLQIDIFDLNKIASKLVTIIIVALLQ